MNIRLVIYYLFTRASYHTVNVLHRPHIACWVIFNLFISAPAYMHVLFMTAFKFLASSRRFECIAIVYYHSSMPASLGSFRIMDEQHVLARLLSCFNPSLGRNTPRIGSGIGFTLQPKGTSLKSCHRGRAEINSSRACN